MRRSTICKTILNDFENIPNLVFNTQAAYNCEQLAYTVKTWFGMSQFSQITCKSTINVVILLIHSAYPCMQGKGEKKAVDPMNISPDNP